jgi:hypothetical protein
MDSQPDAAPDDGSEIATYPADVHDMQTFEVATNALRQFRVPVLLHAGNPHDRLFVALSDGTWEDADKDPTNPTNVGMIRNQLRALSRSGDQRIRMTYIAGAGTQDRQLSRLVDGAFGYTYEQRVEKLYEQFTKQATAWLSADPKAEIHIVEIGFSRGAEQAAGLARLIHERGIRDPGSRVRLDPAGGEVRYSSPALVPGDQLAQAVALFDPVGTGVPRLHDRRLPPSVLSGFQVTAEDEHRGLFKSTSEIDQGVSSDGRFLGVMTAGAHTDVGGGDTHDGLSIRSGNLMIDYINALSDTPFLAKQAEPGGTAMNVVHRSDEGMLLYRLWPKIDRRLPSGVVETLAPPAVCRVVPDCRNAEPRDPLLASRFEFRAVPIGDLPEPSPPVASRLAAALPQPGSPDHALLRQSIRAVHQLESRLGRVPDLSSDRLAAAVSVSAREAGFERVDHVLLDDTGMRAFVVQGGLDSPFRQSIRIGTQSAVTTPVGDSLAQLERLRTPSRQHGATAVAPGLPMDEARTPAMAR